MAYWWVNHKQTSKQELAGGFIWSPQANKDGGNNQSYKNLQLAKVGDIVFSYANTLIKAVGVVERSVVPAVMPSAFGKSNSQWDRGDGFLVGVDWTILNIGVKPKDYIGRIAPLLPKKLSPMQENGNGNQAVYLAAISDGLGELIMLILEGENPSITSIVDITIKKIEDEEEESKIKSSVIPEVYRLQLIKSRTGQGVYRQNLLKIESHCRVTGLADPRFLIASHIRPWRDSNNDEKLDGHNGLLLSPHVDRLFDKAFISFTKAGDILFADEKTKAVASKWKFGNTNIGKLNRSQLHYLEYHREELFEKVRSPVGFMD